MATRATERKLAAIMVADISGFSRLMERDESVTFARLRQLREEVTHRRVGEHGGRLIKTTGDGFLAEFPSAADAMRCALDIQRDVVAREAERSVDTRIRLRIGINVGDIIIDGDDVAGDGVNIAARLEPLAPADGICISAYVREQIHDELGIVLVDLGEQNLKNIARPIRAFAVTLDEGPSAVDATSVAPTVPAAGNFPSIAVLPFVNLSRDEDNEYFADGLAEELLNVLSKIRGLRVASRTSAFSFKGAKVDIATMAQKLNVATILEGSVRKAGKRVRISAQLIHVATDSHLWSETYDRELEDIFAVQDDIAQSVVKELRSALMGEKPDASASASVKAEIQAAARGRGENAEAYRLYLQANFHNDRFTAEDSATAIAAYRASLKLDPNYALAWAGLSIAYAYAAGHGWPGTVLDEAFRLAREAAGKAMRLAPDLAEAHEAMGVIRLRIDLDWTGAEASFVRALELAPGNIRVMLDTMFLLHARGRYDEAIALLRRAVELDPLSGRVYRQLAISYMVAGRLDEAQTAIRRSLELSTRTGFSHSVHSKICLAQGRLDEALEAAKREIHDSFRLFALANVYHAQGRHAESDAALAELIETDADTGAFQIAEVFAYRDDRDQAFAWLERAYAQRDGGISMVRSSQSMRGLHGDPRWLPFLKKVGLAD